jgi:phosphoglycolate phosphatase
MMCIKAILFDKDGTLFDFEASWADWMAETIVRLARGDAGLAGIWPPLRFDCRRAAFSRQPGDRRNAARRRAADRAALAVHERRTDRRGSRKLGRRRADGRRPCPSTRCCAGSARDGYALGVATNATRSELDAHLDAAGVAELAFDFVAGCDSGHGAKPDPGHVPCLRRASGMSRPGSVVMVGDSLHDLKAGRAAGMRTVGVLTGLARRADLLPLRRCGAARYRRAAHGWLSGAV